MKSPMTIQGTLTVYVSHEKLMQYSRGYEITGDPVRKNEEQIALNVPISLLRSYNPQENTYGIQCDPMIVLNKDQIDSLRERFPNGYPDRFVYEKIEDVVVFRKDLSPCSN